MRIARSVEAAMLAHARADAPRECCGLLLGTADEIVDAIVTRNLAPNPATRYLIDPRDHLRAIRDARTRGLQVIGAYHSHPRSDASPSATDAAEGFTDFLFVIVGLAADPPQVTGWSWADGNFAPVPLVRFS
jgi:proteasome lid subunit RPN8/RPN11